MSDHVTPASAWPLDVKKACDLTCLHKITVATDNGPMTITVGLVYLRGNKTSYWSITASGRGFGGCCHEEILKHRPDLKPFVDLHLCDYDGQPSHAVANGAYFLKGYLITRYQQAKGFDGDAKRLVEDLQKRGINEELQKQLGAELSKPVPAVVPQYLGPLYSHFGMKEQVDELVTKVVQTILTDAQGGAVSPEGYGKADQINAAVKEFVERYKHRFMNRSVLAWAHLRKLAELPNKAEFTTVFDWCKENGVIVSIFPYQYKTEEELRSWPSHVKYLVGVERDGKRIEFPFFSAGSARIPDVMQCLASEFQMAVDYDTFESYCNNLGLDEDSRKAEAGFKQLQEFRTKVGELFSREEIDRIAELAEDTINMQG